MQLVASGTLRAQFDSEQKIELLEFITTSHEEYVSRKRVIEGARPVHLWIKDWHHMNYPDNKQSPEMSKKGKAKAMKSPPSAPPEIELPETYLKQKMGITEAVFQFLEVGSRHASHTGPSS